MERLKAVWLINTLALTGLCYSPFSVGAPIVDKILSQASKLNQSGEIFTADSGMRAFTLKSVDGYPGEQTSIRISDTYQVFESGNKLEKPISKASIDWGDGTSSVGFPRLNITHTYGHRDEDGDIHPSSNTTYQGKISFFTNDGKIYTEKFNYELWVNRQGSLARGGRNLDPERIEPVWCLNGVKEDDGSCSSTLFFDQVVFEFEGCYDHTRMQFPVIGDKQMTFDVRDTASIVNGKYNQGWRVQPSINEIANLYGSSFKVWDLGYTSNSSGIFYKFNPVIIAPTEAGTEIDSFTIDAINIQWDYWSKTHGVPVSRSIAQQPSESNGWLGRVRLEDYGGNSSSPPCPYGPRSTGYAWARFGIRATVEATVKTIRSSNDSLISTPGGHHFNKNYEAYINDPRVSE